MSFVPKRAVESFEAAPACPRELEPHLFRFGLRQLFSLVSAAALLCTLLAITSGPWPWIIGFMAALVVAHVAGNVIGTRLRDTSEQVKRWKSTHGSDGPDEPAATPEPVRWAELGLPDQTPLAWHMPTPRRLSWLIAGVAVASGIGGAAALVLLAGERGSWPALALGAVSCGVIGAWAALLASSFWAIARHAWRHAQGVAGGGFIEPARTRKSNSP
jgi:hypothetical protein